MSVEHLVLPWYQGFFGESQHECPGTSPRLAFHHP